LNELVGVVREGDLSLHHHRILQSHCTMRG
jgi:hypothetical protein